MARTSPMGPFPVPTQCPACHGATFVERVRCGACGTAVEGRFSAGWVERLTPTQLAFVEVFLRSRGKIKDVEQALGISYPTVVSRLDEVVEAISRELPRPPSPPEPRPQRRKEILDALASGEIDAEEAARRLRES